MKIQQLLIAVLVLVFVPVTSAQFPSQDRAVVCHHISINVRSEPDLDRNNVIGQIAPGTHLTVLERDRDDYRGYPWTYARVEGTELVGWVFADYIAYLPMYASVTADRVNVRAEPWTHADLLGVFTKAERVEVLGRERIYGNNGYWFYVRSLDSGLQGWMMGEYLYGELCGSELPVMAEASFENPTAATIWGYKPLQLRSADSHDAPYIAEIPNGTRVNILEVYETGLGNDNNQYWTHLQVVGSDVHGWFFSGTIYDDAVLTLPMKIRVVAANLNVRAAPGTDSAIVTKLRQDSCLLVTDSTSLNGVGWFYLPEAGGWVTSEYVDAC